MARCSVMTSSRQPVSGMVSAHTLLHHFGRQRQSICVSHGLLNHHGDNNCFLNSAVQIFWHLDVFRRNFRRLTNHVCLGDACIFCAFKSLFSMFQGSVGTAFSPDILRQALASTFQDQQRFQLGKMDDAAECFENILLRMHYHVQGSSEVATCIDPLCITHRLFTMDLVESVFCHDCRHLSQSLTFSQMVHYVTVVDLLQESSELKQQGVKSLTGSFAKLVHKSNDNVPGHFCRRCGSSSAQLKHTLSNSPVVVTLGFAWSSEKPRSQTIADVLSTIDTSICLTHLFPPVMASQRERALSAVHHLTGMICFYRHHYVAFCYHSRYQTWLSFDDSSVKEIGPEWTQVAAQCLKNHMQPLLLFYTNPEFDLLGDDLRCGTASSCTSATSTLSRQQPVLEHNDQADQTRGKPVPPRPPVRTISRPLPLPHQNRTVSNSTTDHVSPSTAKQTLDRSSQHAAGRHCSRKSSRSSGTSSSVGSTESCWSNSSYDIQRSSYTLGSGCRTSLESSSLKDETDSGYPSSGDHASASSTSGSSVEAPAVKRDQVRLASSPPISSSSSFSATNPTHYVQMLLRADDLLLSASLKEDHGDLSGAIRLFEQASDLLQSCLVPLRFCTQLSQSAQAKQMDCQMRLRALRDKIKASSSTSAIPATHCATDQLTHHLHPISGLVTLPRQTSVPNHALQQQENTIRRMHKSRRKATTKRQMGNAQLNRSLPDLSVSQTSIEIQPCNTLSRKMSTFEAPLISEEMQRARTVTRESLLDELIHRLRKLPQPSPPPVEYEDLPPPPPELLADFDLSQPHDLSDRRFLPSIPLDCTLCGQKPCSSDNSPYCNGCSAYLSRFSPT